jgi:hypothetical protein
VSKDYPTGYESIEDLGDVEVEREPIPARTEVELALTGFDLDSETAGKEHFLAKFECIAPEEHEGNSFVQRMYLGNKPKEGKKATATAWHMTRRTLKGIVAAILQLPESHEDVRTFFAGIEFDPENPAGTLFVGVRDRMRSLIGRTFSTRIGIEQDKEKKYDPKQTVGRPVLVKDDGSSASTDQEAAA